MKDTALFRDVSAWPICSRQLYLKARAGESELTVQALGEIWSTPQMQSFLLTKVNKVSQQCAHSPSKRICCFLGNWRACTAAMARADAYIFLMKCTHAARSLSNGSIFLGQWANFGWGVFLLTANAGELDKPPLLA